MSYVFDGFPDSESQWLKHQKSIHIYLRVCIIQTVHSKRRIEFSQTVSSYYALHVDQSLDIF